MFIHNLLKISKLYILYGRQYSSCTSISRYDHFQPRPQPAGGEGEGLERRRARACDARDIRERGVRGGAELIEVLLIGLADRHRLWAEGERERV